MSKVVTVIPQTRKMYSRIENDTRKRRRVAAYARVSTDNEEQLTSYEAQVDYYTQYIQNNPEWQFVKVFTDAGISATNTKHRDGFNEMVSRAINGEIDLIITKSVSRFARNTVDSLTTVRELKAHNVEVYFEKENIYTFDGKGELLITIMSSLAQEESRSISENVTWGCRKRFADGKLIMPFSSFLGYERGEDGQPKIVESEAKIVRLIYKLFLEGKTPSYIAKQLTDMNVPTPMKQKKWSVSTVDSILRNEKYKGSALLQKKFTTDFLTKKIKVNEGEVPQYYVEESHPAIISKEIYDLAQIEFEKRKNSRNYKPTASCFSGRIFCGDCGGMYGSKVWHSNTKYRRTIWQCNGKFKNAEKCRTPHLTEEVLKNAFVTVFNNMIENKDEVVEFIQKTIERLFDTTAIDKRIEAQEAECSNADERVQDYIYMNSRTVIEQNEYEKHFNELAEICDAETAKLTRLKAERIRQLERKREIEIYLSRIRTQENICEFDEELFCAVVEKITVYDGRLIFMFRDGTESIYEMK